MTGLPICLSQNDFMLQDSWQERIKKLEKPEYEYVTVNNYGRIKKGFFAVTLCVHIKEKIFVLFAFLFWKKS